MRRVSSCRKSHQLNGQREAGEESKDSNLPDIHFTCDFYGSGQMCTQKVSLGALRRWGAVLLGSDALCCGPLRARVRNCECLKRGPCLDRAHSQAQARSVLFGKFRLISHYMLVFL